MNFPERVYNETLESVNQSFPQYVRELQGIADGSQVEFYKVKQVNFNDLNALQNMILMFRLVIGYVNIESH